MWYYNHERPHQANKEKSQGGASPLLLTSIIYGRITYHLYSHLHNYNALDIADFSHQWINHSNHFFDEPNHINGIKNFWNQAKKVFRKYSGIDRNTFLLFIKEFEFRFN